MRPSFKLKPRTRSLLASRRLLTNDDGASAIEFGMVGLPFLLFVLGIIGFGLFFLNTSFLQYGVESAARKIRTGEYKTAGENGVMTVDEFRKLACSAASPVIDCSKMSVLIQHGTDWSGIMPIACVDANGDMSVSTGSKEDDLSQYAGEASEVVLVTLCYKWDLADSFSFLKLGSGADGSGPAILQAATAFKSEPYTN